MVGKYKKKPMDAEDRSDVVARQQPHSVDFEQALLACCIIEGGQESITYCIENKITTTSFYLPSHRLLWNLLRDIYDQNLPVNEMFLIERLQAKQQLDEVGGIEYIQKVVDRIDTPAHLVHYVKRVRDLELVRRVIAASIANIERAYGNVDDLNDFVEKAENEIFAISADRVSDCAVPVRKPIDDAVIAINNMLDRKSADQGSISTGLKDLDKMLFGLHKSEMIVIAARPSVGKTSLAMNIAENVIVANKDHPQPVGVLFFTLEMSSEQLALRMLCGRAGVNMAKLREGFISKEKKANIANTAVELKNAPLWLDESSNLTILEMRAKARRLCSRQPIGLIIIDYLQLINGDNRIPREQQISEISRGVKAMAKEFNVPVIVLSQLNRSSETENRTPRISDLRESGSIEQDADVVLIISKERPSEDIKKKSDDKQDPEAQLDSDTVIRYLLVAKNRNGPTGSLPLTFIRSLTRFENYIDEKFCD